MLLCGHRGVAALAPENTLAGLRTAYRLGLEWVEIDVQLSRDDEVVVIHDNTVNRCSNGRGKVSELEWPELARLDAGGWFDAGFYGEAIPRLSDYLGLAHALGIKVNIELKIHAGDDPRRLCQHVHAVIAQLSLPENTLLFSSFEPACLAHLQQLAPAIARGLLVERLPHDWHAQLLRLGCMALHCNHKYLTHTQARAVNAAGFLLHCYTVNDKTRMHTLADWGVDMIFTDDPQGYQHQP
ncbi:glycerophosphoryl diester phosphodiesterase [Oceanimonas baumannii]|uniref:Glycerophosphoryl diester phosphodiesterase n=1 Tax=Oceanimonas baumannii TaxID=129578 RepID=A0A235CN18_9GAMM|nr:glycerophosphoryl diester phosphodiesterase [Oceanimonas baumannii]OYD25829.1 glycerophosphoryl diester phosphodiesterase [Oceanimonas baumannii]TDW60156.1 glycerophosphoryl diester phosphodiesterase [Oceanimonas baumannii]